MTHGGGRRAGTESHFFAPLVDLPSAAVVATDDEGELVSSLALILRIDGPEFEPVGIVNNTIQDRVAERGLGNNLKPGCYGELAGDQDGATAMAVLDDLHGRVRDRDQRTGAAHARSGRYSRRGKPSGPAHRTTTICRRRRDR